MLPPDANHCFGCSALNPQGLHLQFTVGLADSGELTATAPVQLSRLYEGGPGNLHGGIIATLMDEAMSKLNKPLGSRAMTCHLEVDYLRPAPVDTPLTVRSRVVRQDGRKRFYAAELVNAQGEVLAQATALFIAVAHTALEKAMKTSTA